MTSLEEWQQRWNIPAEAIADLSRSVLHAPEPDKPSDSRKPKSEARIQTEVRLEAAQKDIYLFRNNSGAGAVVDPKKLCSECREIARQFIRWGLGNDSKQSNAVLKSADLIGVRKRLILPEDAYTYIGEFYSREIKAEDWVFSGTPEDLAQLRWATLINDQGGNAKIVKGLGSFD